MNYILNPACPNHFKSTFPFNGSRVNGLSSIFFCISWAALIAAYYSGVSVCFAPYPGTVGASYPSPEFNWAVNSSNSSDILKSFNIKSQKAIENCKEETSGDH